MYAERIFNSRNRPGLPEDLFALPECTCLVSGGCHDWCDLLAGELASRGDRIAFFIELPLTDEQTGESIVPVFWQDNYVPLLPNETRTLTCSFTSTEQPLVFAVRGWNVAAVSRNLMTA